ncbi:MAG: thioesterase family protein [Rhodocyclaceae bacterium]|jgi:4-hydroxybenzoyl-CoA thioesterase
MTETGPFCRDKLIRFHHCDPAGIVFYPQYFILFNELVEDWFRDALGMDFAQLHMEHRLGVPMAKLECEFLSPSKIGEILHLRLTVQRIGGTSIAVLVEGGAEGAVRIRANLVLVLASLDTIKSVPIPPWLRERLERFLAA